MGTVSTTTVPAAERRLGYIVDLSTVTFEETAEGNATSWMHAVPFGEYIHPLYGKLKFTLEKVQRYANNILNGIRGIDIAIDYNHEAEGVAAGWVKNAEVRNDGLWMLIEWTKTAVEKIRNKEYRYFSPEIADEWQHPQTKVKYKDVIVGGGLTNRPFLKDLLPVNLSEFHSNKEEDDMQLEEFLKEARTKLGLAESATDQEILAALQKPEPPKPEPQGQGLSEADFARMIESSPLVKNLQERLKNSEDQNLQLNTALKLKDADHKITTWTEVGGKKGALAPALKEDLQKLLTETPKQLQEQFVKVIDGILENGLVPLGETPRVRTTREGGKTATATFNERVEKLREADKNLSYADAVAEVSRDEQLFEDYRKEATSFTDMEEVN